MNLKNGLVSKLKNKSGVAPVRPTYKYSKLRSLYHFYKPKKHQPSGLIIKFGNRGVGKSTDIAKQYHKQYKKFLKGKGYDHFATNVKIHNADPNFYIYLDLNKHQFTDYIDPDFSEYDISTNEKNPTVRTLKRNEFIALDELGIICGNRDYKNFPKQFTNYVKLIRHFGVYMLTYSQAYDIDKSLRTSANELYLMRKLFNFTLSRRLIKRIVCTKIEDSKDSADEQIHDSVSFAPFLLPSSWNFTYIPFYTDYFNSFE